MKSRRETLIWPVLLMLLSLACGVVPRGIGTPDLTATEVPQTHAPPPETEVSGASCLSVLPVYPGAQAMAQEQADLEDLIGQIEGLSMASGGQVAAYVTSDAPSQVVQFYQEHPPEGTWETALDLMSPESGVSIIWEKDTLSAQVFVSTSEQETLILLGCGPSRVIEVTGEVPPGDWQTYTNPDASFTFDYPVGWVIEDEYFYETAAGERAEHLTVILKQTGNDDPNDRITINPRQPQCEFGRCVEIGPNLIATYSSAPDVQDVFDGIVASFAVR